MGPMENYIDMCSHTMIGRYQSYAQSEYVPYAMPQEHGNHTKTKRLEVQNGLSFASNGYFDMSVSHYSSQMLSNSMHS